MFKNALEGVKKIYYSAICSIATIGLSLGSLLFQLLGIGGDSSFIVLIGGLFGGASLIVCLAGLIFEIIGCYESSKDKKVFMLALYSAIAAILFTCLGVVFSKVTGVIFNALGSISSLLVVFFIIRGLSQILTDLDEIEMVKRGNKVLLLFLIMHAASLVIELVVGIIEILGAKLTLTTLLSIGSGVISLAAAILFMLYVKESLRLIDLSSFKAHKEEVVDVEVKEVEE